MRAEATRRRFLTGATTLVSLLGAGASTAARAQSPSRKGLKRSTLAKPGPMLPPVPAILLTVKGQPGEPDEISVLWTFVVSGEPPQVGVSAGDEHRAARLLALHRQFVLNVPVASLVHPFDVVDMSSSRVADKFALAGLTRGAATTVDAPTVLEAPIQLECRVSHVLRVPARPHRLPRRRRGHHRPRGRLRCRGPPHRALTALLRDDVRQRRVLHPGPEGGAHRPERGAQRHPLLSAAPGFSPRALPSLPD